MRCNKACAILMFLALSLAWVWPAAAADNPFKQPPPFKSAIISYKYEGNQTGHSTVYYKGEVQAEHKTVATKILGFGGSEEKTITITEPRRVTTVDLGKKEAYYTGNYMTYMAQEYEKLSPAEKKTVNKNAEETAGNFMAAMGGKPQISQGAFMNRPVDIVKVMGMTIYTWRGKHVVLKQEGGVLGMQMNMTATDIKTGVPVPSDKLQPPAGIKPVFNKEADQQQKDMAKRVMDMLKDPDFGKKQSRAMQDASRQAQQEQAGQASSSGDSSSKQEEQGDVLQKGLDAAKKIFKW